MPCSGPCPLPGGSRLPSGGLWAGTGPLGTNPSGATTARLPSGPRALQGPMPCLPIPQPFCQSAHRSGQQTAHLREVPGPPELQEEDDDLEGRTEGVCWRAICSNLHRDPLSCSPWGCRKTLDREGWRRGPQPAGPRAWQVRLPGVSKTSARDAASSPCSAGHYSVLNTQRALPRGLASDMPERDGDSRTSHS